MDEGFLTEAQKQYYRDFSRREASRCLALGVSKKKLYKELSRRGKRIPEQESRGRATSLASPKEIGHL